MNSEPLVNLAATFTLVFFRMAGMMMAAPLFGSARVPRRVKLMLALLLSMGMLPALTVAPKLPDTIWALSVGIAGELLFGLAIGTALSFIFVAVNWAGEMIGQQMGLGLGQVFDPQFGAAGSVVGDLYFMLTLVIFLAANGHHAFLRGVMASLNNLPLLSVGMSMGLLDLVTGLLHSATEMAVQLAAPMLVTMLIVEMVMGFLSKTIPQINVMSLGLSLRSLVGVGVLVLSATLTSQVIRQGMIDSIRRVTEAVSSTGVSPVV